MGGGGETSGAARQGTSVNGREGSRRSVEGQGTSVGRAEEAACEFDVIDAANLTERMFFEEYLEGGRPLLVKRYAQNWRSKRFLSKEALMSNHGDTMVDVSGGSDRGGQLVCPP